MNASGNISRRAAVLGLAAGAGAAALGAAPAARAATAGEINAGVTASLNELFAVQPGARGLYDKAIGVLIIPQVIKAGFIVGGAYGEGALLLRGRTDSYWSYGAASIGFQAGGQSTRQALFFMTQTALDQFLRDDGFEVGADAEITLITTGLEVAVDSTEARSPIIAFVFGRKGLLGGASLQGGKYSRIIR